MESKSKSIIDKHGIKRWRLPSGYLHREYGPAVEYKNGNKCWYINGKRHRVGGPAIEWNYDGYKAWYINGKLHREYGPAVEYKNGDKCWYINGKEYSEQEYKKKMRLKKLKYIL